MEQKNLSIRRFRMSDIDGIVGLLRRVFEGDFSREWWKWKYISNPAGFRGEEGDVWIAEGSNGEIVGHWAVIPEKLRLHSTTLVVAQAVDAATHPDYRGHGIFRTLVKNACSDAENRYDFVFGFPNELYRGYEKLGWQSFRMVEFLYFVDFDRSLHTYFRNNPARVLAKTALRVLRTRDYLTSCFCSEKSTGEDVRLEEVTKFSDEMNEFWEQVRSEHTMILERDCSFLNWRFSEHLGDYRKFISRSIKAGKITGYMVTRRTNIRGVRNILDIVDVHSLPHEDKSLINLIEFAIESAKKGELGIVHCRMPQWHKYATFLRSLGFVSLGRAFEYADLYQPRLIFNSFAGKTQVNADKWFCTLADTDYA